MKILKSSQQYHTELNVLMNKINPLRLATAANCMYLQYFFLKFQKEKICVRVLSWETSETTHIASQGEALEGVKLPK